MNLHDIIEAATPGPWRVKGSKAVDADSTFPGAVSHYHLANCICPSGPVPKAWLLEAEANARHIATFDPTLTAAMLAVCEAVQSKMPGCEECLSIGLGGPDVCDEQCSLGPARSALCALESLLTERGLTMGEDDE